MARLVQGAATNTCLVLALFSLVGCGSGGSSVSDSRPSDARREDGGRDARPQDRPPAIDGSRSDGTAAKGFVVEDYDESRAFNGTTLLTDPITHRAFEIDMRGNVLWQWVVPQQYLKKQFGPGEVDLLANGNVLVLLDGYGIVEVSRGTDGHQDGEIVWSLEVSPLDHDADRLDNGHVIYVYGMGDKKGDTNVTEVDAQGKVVWSWAAASAYAEEFPSSGRADWAHTNAVQRLADGNTLISLRNFFISTIVDASGKVVRDLRYDRFGNRTDPHEPNMLPSGNLLVCLQNGSPYQAVEVAAGVKGQVDPDKDVVWSYQHPTGFRTSRDCDRLANGNTMIVGVQCTGAECVESSPGESTVIEVTPDGDIVWRLTLRGYDAVGSPGFLYKAQRLGPGATLSD